MPAKVRDALDQFKRLRGTNVAAVDVDDPVAVQEQGPGAHWHSGNNSDWARA